MSNINVVRKNLGPVTAYKYAVQQGYTGTEQEFAALMASYATVAEEASESAASAASSAAAAEDAADRAEAAAEQAEGAIVVDDTLSVEGRAADAKVTGDRINTGLGAANDLSPIEWEDGYVIWGNTGVKITNASYKCTDYIPIGDISFGIKYKLSVQNKTAAYALYNDEKQFISAVVGDNSSATIKTGLVALTDDTKYIRFSTLKGVDCYVRSYGVLTGTGKIRPDAVNTSALEKKSVTRDKCSFIKHDPETNYIDKTKYTNGYISSLGNFISNSSWRATDYCELAPNTQYYSSQLYGGYCAFYKADKTLIAAYGVNAFTTSSFTTPAETAFGRFSMNAASASVNVDNAWIYTANEKPKDYAYVLDGVGVSDSHDLNPCDYAGNEISIFNKILCIGDSMTEGTFNHLDSGSTQWVTYSKYAYPAHLHKMTGVDITSLGHGGKTAVQWYEIEQDSDLSGYDCAIIQLGINDYGTYGELGDDTKTAFQNIISKLKTQNKNIKIFVANIIPATSYSTAGYKQFSSDLLDWLETTYESDKDVIPVDIQQYGHTGDSSAYNCGHLSALGYHRLAEDYKGFISWYINQNKDVFSEVQFIGTDYWYTNPST